MEKVKLFGTGFLQVSLVASQTWLILHQLWIAIFITAFLISYIWTWNVKRVVFGDAWDRVAYASGAAVGTIVGLLTVSAIFG